MSKKNRDLQVVVKEEKVTYEGQAYPGTTLWFGKNKMGTIIPDKKGGYLGFMAGDENNKFRAKYFDECVESVIKEWNLHHN